MIIVLKVHLADTWKQYMTKLHIVFEHLSEYFENIEKEDGPDSGGNSLQIWQFH